MAYPGSGVYPGATTFPGFEGQPPPLPPPGGGGGGEYTPTGVSETYGSVLILCDRNGAEMAELEVPHTFRFEVSRASSVTFTLGYDQVGASELLAMLGSQLPRVHAYRQSQLISTALWAPQQEVVDGTDQAGIQCEFRSPFSRLETRVLSAKQDYDTMHLDQIVWDLIDRANNQSDMGIGKGHMDSLDKHTRHYPAGQNIGEAITDMTDALDSTNSKPLFRFTETFLPPSSQSLSLFNVWSSYGRDLTTSNVRFELGAGTLDNVTHVERTIGYPVNRVVAIGYDGVTDDNPAGGPLIAIANHAGSQATWGLFATAVDHSTIKNRDTLGEKAAKEIVPEPLEQITCEVDVQGFPQPFEDYWLNDLVRLHARHDAFQTDVNMQITAIEIDRDGDGLETAHRLEFGDQRFRPMRVFRRGRKIKIFTPTRISASSTARFIGGKLPASAHQKVRTRGLPHKRQKAPRPIPPPYP